MFFSLRAPGLRGQFWRELDFGGPVQSSPGEGEAASVNHDDGESQLGGGGRGYRSRKRRAGLGGWGGGGVVVRTGLFLLWR